MTWIPCGCADDFTFSTGAVRQLPSWLLPSALDQIPSQINLPLLSALSSATSFNLVGYMIKPNAATASIMALTCHATGMDANDNTIQASFALPLSAMS